MTATDPGGSVLLVHGQPGSRLVWSRVGPMLAADGLDVLCLDRPGYGRACGPALNQFGNAASMAAALDERSGAPVVVVGHSLGAGIALALAAIAPEHVRAAVLLAPAVGPAAVTRVDRALGAPVLGPSLSWLACRGAGVILGVPWLRRRVLDARVGRSDRNSREVVRRLRHSDVWRTFTTEQRYLLIDAHLLEHELPTVTCPVVILTGRRDRVVRPRVAEALVAGLADAALVATDAGHLLPVDAPDAVVAAVLRAVAATAGVSRQR